MRLSHYRRQKISHPILLSREHIFVFNTTLRARDITISRPRTTYFIGSYRFLRCRQLAAFVRPIVPKKRFICLVKNGTFARAWKLRFLEQLQYLLCTEIEQHSVLAFNFDSVQ